MVNEIIEIILDNCEDLESKTINVTDRFVEDLNVSSMEVLSILSDIEDEYDVKISSSQTKKLKTVQDLIDYVEENK